VISSLTAVQRQRTPDEQARLERMIRDDYAPIWRFLRRLGLSAEHAEDATQQVFLIAAERLADIREQRERAFAYGTALRVATSMRRRNLREPLDLQDGSHPSPLPSPEELSDQRRARERLDRVLAALPLELRSVFVLFELEGLTSPEIAELSALPLGTVASRLRRARESFRRLLDAQTGQRPSRGEQA
jgi:RNA polymerase sigma-70 factor (ECF subfamily)